MPRKKSQNKNSGYKDKLFRIDAELAADLESISSIVKERCTMSAPLYCGKRATGRRS